MIFPLVALYTIHHRNKKFKSNQSKPTKSIDSFIEVKSNVIGFAEVFIQLNGKLFVIMEQFIILKEHYHLKEVESLKKYKVFESTYDMVKLIYLKYDMKEIVSTEPNYYEN